jgi:uncharacterized delta-60 repeat protein
VTAPEGGKVLTQFDSLHEHGSDNSDEANAVAIQSDGRIVAAGATTNTFALARYNGDGSLDHRFGRGGRVVTDFGALALSNASAVAIQRDGKIVVAGVGEDVDYHVALARFSTEGKLDPSFGDDGKVVPGLGAAAALALQRDGRIVVAGQGPRSSFSLLRLTLDGRLDSG